MASAGISQGAPQSDPSLARILQEQRYSDDNDIITIIMIMIMMKIIFDVVMKIVNSYMKNHFSHKVYLA